MPPYPIKESFQWMTPEFRTSSTGKKSIKIRGVALTGNATSKNNRLYVETELEKAARTWVNKPVTVNHSDPEDKHNIIGNVDWCEYENGALEYLATIKKQPYIDLLRNKSTKIRGVSIEAMYLNNVCPKCGERFYTEQDFHRHMHDVHFLETNSETHPHGIAGTALSLVLSPEEPGYSGTTIELMEKYTTQPQLVRLLETVIKTAKEKETMKTAEKKGVPYLIKEQDETPPEPEKDEHGCGPDEEWDGTKCVPKKEEPTATEQATSAPNTGTQSEGEPEKLTCPEGFHLVTDDQGNQTCEADLPPPPIDKPTATEADANPVQPAVSTQVAPQAEDGVVVTVTDTQSPCPTGQHRDPTTGLCIADDAVVEPPPNIATEAVKLPRILKLGEPFAGYKNMDDCIAKNPDKEDPAAYCATIMRKVEGDKASEIKESKDIYETQQTLTKKLQEIDTRGYARDAQLATSINSVNRAAAANYRQAVNVLNHVNAIAEKTLTDTKKLTRNVESAANHNLLAETKKLRASDTMLQSQIKEVTATSTKNHQQLQSQIIEATEAATKSHKQLQEYTTAQISKLATSTAKELQTLRKANPQTIKEMQQLRHEIEETKQLATQQKKDFETILATADKTVENLQEQVKTLEEWKATQEKQLTETQKKEKDKKTQQDTIKEALEPLQTQISNLEAKLHGNFKQTHKTPPNEESADDSDQLPYDSD